MRPDRSTAVVATLLLALALPAAGAASPAAYPRKADPAPEDQAAYRALQEASEAVVEVRTRALGNARSSQPLGADRSGSGGLLRVQNTCSLRED